VYRPDGPLSTCKPAPHANTHEGDPSASSSGRGGGLGGL